MKKLEYYLPHAANFQVTWINLENEQRLQKTSLVSHCENVWPKRNNSLHPVSPSILSATRTTGKARDHSSFSHLYHSVKSLSSKDGKVYNLLGVSNS